MNEDKVIFAPTARRLSETTTTESPLARQQENNNHASGDEPRGRMSPPPQGFPKRMIPDHGIQRRQSSSTGASDEHLSEQTALRMLEARFQSEGDFSPREGRRSFVDGRPMLRSFPTAGVSQELLLEAVYRRRECDEDRLVARVAAAVVKPLENRLNELEKTMSDVILKLVVSQAQNQATEAQSPHLRSQQSRDRDLPIDARLAGAPETSAISSVLRPYLAAAAADALSSIRQVQVTETGLPPLSKSSRDNRRPSLTSHWEPGSAHLGDDRSRRPPSLGALSRKPGNGDLQGQTVEDVIAAARFSTLVGCQQSPRQGHPQDHHQQQSNAPAAVFAHGVVANTVLPSPHSSLQAPRGKHSVNDSVKACAASTAANQSPASLPKRKREERASREYPGDDGNERTSEQPQAPPADWAEPRERKRRPQQCSVCGLPRFGTFGHTIEGWCPVHSQWGARSKCSICGEMRSKIPGHLPDGFCPTQKKWDQSIQRRHHAEAAVSEQPSDDLASQPTA